VKKTLATVASATTANVHVFAVIHGRYRRPACLQGPCSVCGEMRCVFWRPFQLLCDERRQPSSGRNVAGFQHCCVRERWRQSASWIARRFAWTSGRAYVGVSETFGSRGHRHRVCGSAQTPGSRQEGSDLGVGAGSGSRYTQITYCVVRRRAWRTVVAVAHYDERSSVTDGTFT